MSTLWLPSDYSQLTIIGQREARVAVAGQHSTPEAAVAGWAFFRDYYLVPDPEDGFDPGFYKYYLGPSPLHSALVRWLWAYKASAVGAPRKSAKSTTVLSEELRQLLVCPSGWSINQVKAKDDFVIDDFEAVKYQLETNRRIIEDFGEQKPPRGRGLWSNHRLILRNRNSYRGLSVDGKLRGPIADLTVLDDVEDDKSNQSRNDQRLAELKERLLKVIMPMLDRSGHVLVDGTLLDMASFLFHIIHTTEDQRFRSVAEGGHWFKINVPAEDKTGRNVWRAKYTPEWMAQQRALLGDSFFQTEFMGDPRSEQDALFTVRPLEHEYQLLKEDELETTAPFQCITEVQWHERSGEPPQSLPVVRVFKDWIADLHRGITVDYAPGLSSSNDYSAVLVWGLDPRNNLFVLDGWFGRQPSPRLTTIVWQYALLWNVAVIGVEAVSVQMEVYNRIREYGEKLREQMGWCPVCVPIRYPANLSKSDRIAALEWRFNHGRIKLPAHRRTHGPIAELYKQIRNFTPDLRGLPHDDVIDTLAMAQYVTRTGRPPPNTPDALRTPVEMLKAGELYIPGTEVSLAGCVDFSRLTLPDIEAIMSMARDRRAHNLLGDPLVDAESDGWPDLQTEQEVGGPEDLYGSCPIFRPSY